MKTIPILHSRITGSGPVVVLLHGYMATSLYWEAVTRELAKTYRVIAIDLLGYGNSPKPRRSMYDYGDQLDSINATLAHLRIQNPFTLIGHSMGSLVALRYARHNQNRIKKLVLANMPLWKNKDEARTDIYGTHATLYKFILHPILHPTSWFLFRMAMRFRLLPDTVLGGVRERREYLFQSSAKARLRSLRNIIYASRVEADLAALKVKTTMLTGLNDNKNYLYNLSQYRLGTNISSRLIADGHHLPLTQPKLVARAITS